MSPGGLGSGLGSGSGVVRRKVVGKMCASPSPSPAPSRVADEVMVDGDAQPKAKDKKTSAGKKRVVKSKAALSDESDDDDFMPNLASPTANKKRRLTLAITDTPTATSARPSRSVPLASTYTAPQSSPSASSSGGDFLNSAYQRPANLNSEQVKKAWNLEEEGAAPTGRLQELLEANGVNTPGNRYDEHFLQRHNVVVTNPVTSIPETVRRMAEPKPRLTAEQMVDILNKAHLVSIAVSMGVKFMKC